MNSEQKIKTEISKDLESNEFRKLDVPVLESTTTPDLVLEYGKIIQLIEIKVGSPKEYLPYGLYSSINRTIRTAKEHFSGRGYIVKAFLATNQNIHYENLISSISLINSLESNKIVEVIKTYVDSLEKTFDESLKELLKNKGEEAILRNLQTVVQLNPLINEPKLKEIIKIYSNNPSAPIRGELCYLLGRLDFTDAIPKLINFLSDPNEYVRSQAFEALSNLRKKMEQQVEEEMRREEEAYLAMEDELLKKHPSHYAGFYKGELISVKPNKAELMGEVEKKIGKVRYYIRRISKEIPKVRLPKPRKLGKM